MLSWRKVLVGLTAAASSALVGCAAQSPAWIDSPSAAFCVSGLNQHCLTDFGRAAYLKATEDKAQPEAPIWMCERPGDGTALAGQSTEPHSSAASKDDDRTAKAVEGSSPESKPQADATDSVATEMSADPVSQLGFWLSANGVAFKGDISEHQSLAANSDFVSTGTLLYSQPGFSPVAQLAKVEGLEDGEDKAYVLAGFLTLYGHLLSDVQVNKALNQLMTLDDRQYRAALMIKLPRLLMLADLERASALRSVLLSGGVTKGQGFSVLAVVASFYAIAGYADDAKAIVANAVASGTELGADDRKVIAMALGIARGGYPAMQEFYDYQSDEVRLSAYLTIAMVGRQVGQPRIANKALGDAVRFVQKSAVKIDRVSATAQILSLAPGIVD